MNMSRRTPPTSIRPRPMSATVSARSTAI